MGGVAWTIEPGMRWFGPGRGVGTKAPDGRCFTGDHYGGWEGGCGGGLTIRGLESVSSVGGRPPPDGLKTPETSQGGGGCSRGHNYPEESAGWTRWRLPVPLSPCERMKV